MCATPITTPTAKTPAETVAGLLAGHPGATAADLAERAGIGRSTAAKCLAALERQGIARRTAGGRDGGRRLPDRWALASEQRTTAPTSDGTARLGKGALRDLVLDYVTAHAAEPDGEGVSPTAVAKGLGGRSSGAVGNALVRLERDGKVTQASESPRRYRLAPA